MTFVFRVFLYPHTIIYTIVFERTWWRLFQKRVVRTQNWYLQFYFYSSSHFHWIENEGYTFLAWPGVPESWGIYNSRKQNVLFIHIPFKKINYTKKNKKERCVVDMKTEKCLQFYVWTNLLVNCQRVV